MYKKIKRKRVLETLVYKLDVSLYIFNYYMILIPDRSKYFMQN